MSQPLMFTKLFQQNFNSIFGVMAILFSISTGSVFANTLTDEEDLYQSLYPNAVKTAAHNITKGTANYFEEDSKPWTQEQIDQMKNSFRMFQDPAIYPQHENNDADGVRLWDIAHPIDTEKRADTDITIKDNAITNPYSDVLKKVEHITYDSLTSPYSPLITKYAEAANVDSTLISLIIKYESNFNSKIVSPKGAKGLMQLMDSVSTTYGVDPFEPEDNIKAGVAYFSSLMKRYNNDTKLALAAYNAGPGAVDKFNGVPPYKETQDYVAKILLSYSKLKGDINNSFAMN